MNDPELATLRARAAGRSALFGAWRRKRAARRLAALGTPGAAAALAQAFTESDDRSVIEIARQALVGMSDPTMIDAVCDFLIAGGDERLGALVDEAGHAPSDPGRRALLLFLDGQFERYAELDIDGTLLAAGHATADDELRARLAARARAAGRVEWVRAIAGRGQRRLAELSDGEWQTAFEVLTKAGHWKELWEIAMQAPPVRGAPILRKLRQCGWRPEDDAEQRVWQELTVLADACRKFPAGGLFEETSIFEVPLGGINSIALTPDGRLLAIANWGKIRLWRLPSGKPAGALQVHTYKYKKVETYEGRYFDTLTLIGSSYKSARIVTQTHTSTGSRARCLAVAPNGKQIAGICPDGNLLLWRLPSGEPASTPQGHALRSKSLAQILAMTLDGRLFATLGDGGTTVQLWRPHSGEPVSTLNNNSYVFRALAMTPDGKLLATATTADDATTVRLWRLPRGEPASTLRVPEVGVSALAITPDGTLLASASRNGPVRLWRSRLVSASHMPVGEISLEEVERWWQSRDELPPVERAWVELIAALVRWRHRHDVELDTASPTVDAGERDIELDG